MRLIKAEFRKITSTNLWWILMLAVVGFTALALLINLYSADSLLSGPQIYDGMSPEEAELARSSWVEPNPVAIAANIYTSGQFFGLLLTMVLSILLVTNEYFHQTATTTFLITPHRSSVIAGKLAAAVIWGAGLWLVTTVLSVGVGAIFLASEDVGSQLTEWGVIRSMGLNLLAYAVWSIFGVGLGTLIRSQVGAVVTAVVTYLIGTAVAQFAFAMLSRALDAPWIEKAQIIVPSIASQLMITGAELPGNPPQWLGAAILIGYAAIAGGIGVFLTQRRDIS